MRDKLLASFDTKQQLLAMYSCKAEHELIHYNYHALALQIEGTVFIRE